MSAWNDINCSFIDILLTSFISLNDLLSPFYSVLYPPARFECNFDWVTLYIRSPSASPSLTDVFISVSGYFSLTSAKMNHSSLLQYVSCSDICLQLEYMPLLQSLSLKILLIFHIWSSIWCHILREPFPDIPLLHWSRYGLSLLYFSNACYLYLLMASIGFCFAFIFLGYYIVFTSTDCTYLKLTLFSSSLCRRST